VHGRRPQSAVAINVPLVGLTRKSRGQRGDFTGTIANESGPGRTGPREVERFPVERKRDTMLILIIILVLILGGGSGFYGHSRWGAGGGAGIGLGTVLLILLVAYFLGFLR